MSGNLVGFEVEIKGLKEQLEKLEKFADIAEPELMIAMDQTVTTVQSEARSGAPVGVSGELRASINGKVTHTVGTDVRGVVGTSVLYGMPVERGTRPHYPPLEPLMLWVQRKLQVPDGEVVGVARAIQRKIGRRGTKGKKFLEAGYQVSKDRIDRYFRSALERIVNRLAVNGGGDGD